MASRIFPTEFGSQVTTPSSLDVDDAFMVSIDGSVKNVAPAAARGFIDANHYADLNETVINTCESITGFTTTLGVQDGGIIQLDPAIFTTGSNSVKAKIYVNRSPTAQSFYWNTPSDITIGNYVEAAFNLRSDGLDASAFTRAFVASGVDRTGTVVYADDFTRQFPNDADHRLIFYTIRIPLQGLTAIRSIGITQHEIPALQTSGRCFFWFDNMVLREATGLDRAVYGAAANSHVVIPATYTSAKTQLPIFNEAAGVTWEDRRT